MAVQTQRQASQRPEINDGSLLVEIGLAVVRGTNRLREDGVDTLLEIGGQGAIDIVAARNDDSQARVTRA
jgi:hypothetical protein